MTRHLYFVLIISLISLNRGCEGLFFGVEPNRPSGKDVEFYTDKLIYNSNEDVKVILKNNSTRPLFLAGCSPFLIANKTDSGWVMRPLYICVWEGFAKKVKPGEHYVETFSAASFVGRHKMFTTIYWECKDGLPISQAQCGDEQTISSPEFYIKP